MEVTTRYHLMGYPTFTKPITMTSLMRSLHYLWHNMNYNQNHYLILGIDVYNSNLSYLSSVKLLIHIFIFQVEYQKSGYH